MLKAVIFDLDGTLLDRDAASERWFRSVLERRGDLLPFAKRPEALARFLELDAHGYDDRARFCRDVVKEFPGVAESPAMFWSEFTAGLAVHAQAEPAVTALVDSLSTKMPFAILTNGSIRTQRAKLKAARLDHLTAFISEEIGVEKPDPAAFAQVLRHFGIAQAAEVLFVGDDPVRDVQGAHAAGLRTCWVSRGRSWSLDGVAPDHVVAHVCELERFEELRR